MEGTPLLDVMRGLILEPEAQADFAADPSGYMQRFGYDDVPEEDLREAVGLVADTLPPDVAHAVNTAASAEPGDDDAYGDGTVGLLGRISTAEVTESVVPDLDELPPDDAGPDDAFDDDLAGDHDATTFGEVTRDFDDDTDTDRDTDTDTDDVDADDDGVPGEHHDVADDDGSPDVSFGGGFDDDGPVDVDDGPEAFGHGSAAFDDDIGDATFDADAPAIDGDDSFDDPGFGESGPDDAFDDAFDAGDHDIGYDDDPDFDGPDDGDFDGDDPGDFDGDVGQF